MLGGTTAVSGGGAWLPGNHLMEKAGIADSREDALAYIRRLTAGREPDPELLEVFVDTAPEVLRYLEDHTPLETHIRPLPDYYWPWGFPGNRRAAGPHRSRPIRTRSSASCPSGPDRLVKRGTLMSLGTATTLTEDFLPQTPELLERAAPPGGGQDIRPKGAALIARLFKGLLERGVEALLETPARELVTDDAGDGDRGRGRAADGRDLRIGARKGVVLACGGFEWNPELVRAPHRLRREAVEPAQQRRRRVGHGRWQAGAKTANLDSYWGTPVMFDPEITRDGEMVPQFEWARGARRRSWSTERVSVRQRGAALQRLPQVVRVCTTRSPVEFPNAGPGLHDLRPHGARFAADPLNVPGPARPRLGGQGGDASGSWPIGSESTGPALEATVARYNDNARRGEDPDFHRHERGLMAPGQVAPTRAASVLRGGDLPGRPRHQRRPADRPQRPGAASSGAGWSAACMRPAIRRPTSSGGPIRAEAAPSATAWCSGSWPAGTWPASPPGMI